MIGVIGNIFILLAVANGTAFLEALTGPLIQFQGMYIKDPTDMNCSYIYLLFSAFGVTSLMALGVMSKLQSVRS